MSERLKRKKLARKISLSDEDKKTVRKASGLEALENRLFRRLSKLSETQISEVYFLINLTVKQLDYFSMLADKRRQLKGDD